MLCVNRCLYLHGRKIILLLPPVSIFLLSIYSSSFFFNLYIFLPLLSYSLLSKKLKIKICRTIILPVVLHGCETWSLTLREERRLSVFENRFLRNVWA
jgi:hypothetical protein